MFRSLECAQRRAGSVIALLASCLVAGCAASGSQVDDLGVAAIQFGDIPVPAAMRLSDSKYQNHSYEVGGFRHGDFVYKGRTPPDEAVAYMIDRMAIHGWELRDRQQSADATTLVFWRRPYETTCAIRLDAATTHMTVAVRTHLGRAADEVAAAP